MTARWKFLLAGALSLAAAGVGFWAAVQLNTPPPGGEETRAARADARLATLDLDDMFVNIQGRDPDGLPHDKLMRIQIAVLYDETRSPARVATPGPGGPDGLAAYAPMLRDAFLAYLRGIDERDIAGSAGLAQMKTELLKRARLVTGSDAPHDILIADLVIQ